jgi:hypothetical protein
MEQGSAWMRAPVVGRRTDPRSTGSCVDSSCCCWSFFTWAELEGPAAFEDAEAEALLPLPLPLPLLLAAAASLPMADCMAVVVLGVCLG